MSKCRMVNIGFDSRQFHELNSWFAENSILKSYKQFNKAIKTCKYVIFGLVNYKYEVKEETTRHGVSSKLVYKF